LNLDWLRGRGTHEFIHSLPWRSRLILFTAIFFTFGSVGFIDDVFSVRDLKPWPLVLVHVVYVGLVAVGYIWAISTTRWLIPLARRSTWPSRNGFHRAAAVVGGGAAHRSLTLVQHRLSGRYGCIICITLPASLPRFIAWEGRAPPASHRDRSPWMHATLVPRWRWRPPGSGTRAGRSRGMGGDLRMPSSCECLVICVATSRAMEDGRVDHGMVKQRSEPSHGPPLAGLLNDLDGGTAALRSRMLLRSRRRPSTDRAELPSAICPSSTGDVAPRYAEASPRPLE
jgi:hypothetical protein